MPRILWRDAQGIEGSLDLTSTEIRVGRAMDCAIRTDDAMVSRHHSRIYWGGSGYLLEDLGSANGVYFQEQRVQSHMFKHGDAVRCGSLWLRFVDVGGASPSPGSGGQPMQQHPGMGAIASAGPTGHVAALPQAPPSSAQPAQGGAAAPSPTTRSACCVAGSSSSRPSSAFIARRSSTKTRRAGWKISRTISR